MLENVLIAASVILPAYAVMTPRVSIKVDASGVNGLVAAINGMISYRYFRIHRKDGRRLALVGKRRNIQFGIYSWPDPDPRTDAAKRIPD